MSHSMKKQRHDQKRNCAEPVEYDEDYAVDLMHCINSGQVEPDQLVQHFEAGELNDNKEQK